MVGSHVGIGIVVGSLAVAFVVGTPREAKACSCFGSSSLVAPVGAEHPVGAPLVFESFCGGSMDSWSVTVDGAAAMLVSGGGGIHRVAIDPAPPQGAEVVLSVDCSSAFEVPDCTDSDAVVERARFVIGAADTSAPPPAESIVLDQEDGEFEIGCFEDALDLRISAVVHVGAREPGAWAEVRFLRDGVEIQGSSHAIPDNGAVQSSHYVDGSELAGTEMCVSVAVVDAAGNASPAAEDCEQFAADRLGCTIASAPIDGTLALAVFVLLRRRRPR